MSLSERDYMRSDRPRRLQVTTKPVNHAATPYKTLIWALSAIVVIAFAAALALQGNTAIPVPAAEVGHKAVRVEGELTQLLTFEKANALEKAFQDILDQEKATPAEKEALADEMKNEQTTVVVALEGLYRTQLTPDQVHEGVEFWKTPGAQKFLARQRLFYLQTSLPDVDGKTARTDLVAVNEALFAGKLDPMSPTDRNTLFSAGDYFLIDEVRAVASFRATSAAESFRKAIPRVQAEERNVMAGAFQRIREMLMRNRTQATQVSSNIAASDNPETVRAALVSAIFHELHQLGVDEDRNGRHLWSTTQRIFSVPDIGEMARNVRERINLIGDQANRAARGEKVGSFDDLVLPTTPKYRSTLESVCYTDIRLYTEVYNPTEAEALNGVKWKAFVRSGSGPYRSGVGEWQDAFGGISPLTSVIQFTIVSVNGHLVWNWIGIPNALERFEPTLAAQLRSADSPQAALRVSFVHP